MFTDNKSTNMVDQTQSEHTQNIYNAVKNVEIDWLYHGHILLMQP